MSGRRYFESDVSQSGDERTRHRKNEYVGHNKRTESVVLSPHEPHNDDRELAVRDQGRAARTRPREPTPSREAAYHPAMSLAAMLTTERTTAAGRTGSRAAGPTAKPIARKNVAANKSRNGASTLRA